MARASAGPTGDPASDLVVRAAEGDHDAYAELVARHRHLAFRVAYLIVGSAAEAEDAVQEGFVKAYLALDRFRPGSEYRPWLLKNVGNEARNLRRSSGRRAHYETRAGHEVSLAGSVPSPEAEAEASDVHRRLLRAVDALPEQERLVIALHYFLELSEAETAKAVGVPRGTVKSRLSRARRRLAATLEVEHG